MGRQHIRKSLCLGVAKSATCEVGEDTERNEQGCKWMKFELRKKMQLCLNNACYKSIVLRTGR